MSVKNLTIKSYITEYEVIFTQKVNDLIYEINKDEYFYLIDANVFRLYENKLSPLISNSKYFLINAIEENKFYDKAESLLIKLIESGIKKNQTLIVIGGGITQDIGCFISHIYRRGIKWFLIPTTLLSQADSCIGSKSSINIGNYKNQIGTFYPPNKVFVCSEFLQTLDQDAIDSGIGEIIKLALIDGRDSYLELRSKLDHSNNEINLLEIIQKCLSIKKPYIEQDEFDNGIRNLLNYGHTFAHAFESASHFKIPHGIAVIFGMQAATYFSLKLKLVTNDDAIDFINWSKKFTTEFDQIFYSLSFNEIKDAFKTDKKNDSNKIRFILPHDYIYGNMKAVRLDLELEVVPLLQDFFKNTTKSST